MSVNRSTNVSMRVILSAIASVSASATVKIRDRRTHLVADINIGLVCKQDFHRFVVAAKDCSTKRRVTILNLSVCIDNKCERDICGTSLGIDQYLCFDLKSQLTFSVRVGMGVSVSLMASLSVIQVCVYV